MEMEESAEAVINKLVLPVTEPNLAVMFTLPGLWPVAEPDAEIVATVLSELDQVTCELMFWVVPSLNNPDAEYWREAPGGRKVLAGVTVIDTRVAEDTVTGTVADTPPGGSELLAVMFAVPAAAPVTWPVVLPTLATDEFDEDHAVDD